MVSSESELDKKSKFNIIIFLATSILAIHHLIFLISFEINFPYSVDLTDEFLPIFNLLINNEFTLLLTKGVHIIFFPKLISLPILYLSNFDVTILYYLQWVVVSISVYIFYLILNQTEKKILWTIVPISAFLYSPLTSSGYWSIALLAWYFPMLGILATVYFLNKKRINPQIFGTGIFFAILSTFSIVVGVTAWIAGLITILKNSSKSKIQDKKWISLWIMSTIIIGIFYFYLVSDNADPTYFELIFTPAGFSFITHYLASSFRLKFDFLMISVGSISLILSSFFLYYFNKKQNITKYLPWFIFLLIGISGAIITASGRVQFLDSHLGNEPYYSPISQFFQIGLLVLSAKLIYEFKKIPKKNLVVIFFLIIIIVQMILLIPSYYTGWQRADYYYDEKTQFISCFSLNPDKLCQEFYHTFENDYLQMINHLIINKQSIFDDYGFNEKNDTNLENFSDFEKNVIVFSSNNRIDSINEILMSDKAIYDIDTPILFMSGWLTTDQHSTIEELYILLDDIPILMIDDYNIETIVQDDDTHLLSWSIYFMSGYIENGCHLINLVGITENEKIYNNQEITICLD